MDNGDGSKPKMDGPRSKVTSKSYLEPDSYWTNPELQIELEAEALVINLHRMFQEADKNDSGSIEALFRVRVRLNVSVAVRLGIVPNPNPNRVNRNQDDNNTFLHA